VVLATAVRAIWTGSAPRFLPLPKAPVRYKAHLDLGGKQDTFSGCASVAFASEHQHRDLDRESASFRECHHPIVIVREVWETDADAPGLGRCDVRIENAERFTTDLRCRLCGLPAIQVLCDDLKGITCDRTDRT
jgi:hypothetical protein